jgi:ABC-2 type transport system ATP-binding protein
MLKLDHVTKYYDKFLAVDDISFEIEEGEIFGLLGVNGAGKTTTFRMIVGLLEKTKGKITLFNKKIDYNQTDKIGFLTEERSLLPSKTVYEQAIFYGTLKGMDEDLIEERLDEYLKEFKIEEYKNRKIKELSKGNQQKVQFITSILHKPKLLILDEPFSGLDPINVEMFKEAILKLKKEKTIIIFSSHRMDHVEYFCDSLIILVKGKSVLQGKLKDIKDSYKRKNIRVIADLDKSKIEKIKGVLEVEKELGEYVIKVEDESIVDNVFKEISKCKHVEKFLVEAPSLHEIFISKVGESYEE